jgi:ABC-type multidrug transport system ATPase subunit
MERGKLGMTEYRPNRLVCKGLSAGYAPGRFVSKNINFEINAGEIMAIMGPSGSGKSTLLQALFGKLTHVKGQILVNGVDVTSSGLACIRAEVGHVPQDDVLVNELTVRENIQTFHDIAIDSGQSRAVIDKKITECLKMLEIDHVANSKVGSADGSKNGISGGQRKRANIAMELVNNPRILILDEPTSGLSSRDSLALMDNLVRMAKAQNTMVLMIIHQPSSDIFKKIDRLLILDRKGNGVCSGPRNDVMDWVNKNLRGKLQNSCTACSSEFPDKMMALVESKEEGWSNESKLFSEGFAPENTEYPLNKNALIRSPLAWFSDLLTLIKRQLMIKSRDHLTRLLILAAPPVLGLLIGAVFKSAPEGSEYAFETNAMFPQMLFMLIICGMFLGLVSSVFEVIKDRAILRREQMRGLSTTTYYLSELGALFLPGLIQAFLLSLFALAVVKASFLLWVVFTGVLIALMIGVVLGLLLSSVFASPIAAYNMIPVLLIPQIVLGGALLPYKDMGDEIFLWNKESPLVQPILAKAMPASWAYEMLVRKTHLVTAEKERAQNASIRAIEDLPAGAFLALEPERQIRESVWQSLPGTEDEKPKAHHADLVVLVLMLALIAGSTLLWIRREFSKSNELGLFIGGQAGILLTGVLAYSAITVASTDSDTPTEIVNPAKPLNYQVKVSTHSYGYRSAENFCREDGTRMANVDEILSAFNKMDPVLPQELFWTGEPVGESERIYAIDFSKLDMRFRGDLSKESLSSQPRVLFAAKKNQFWAYVACVQH